MEIQNYLNVRLQTNTQKYRRGAPWKRKDQDRKLGFSAKFDSHQLSDAQKLGKTTPYRKSTMFYEENTFVINMKIIYIYIWPNELVLSKNKWRSIQI